MKLEQIRTEAINVFSDMLELVNNNSTGLYELIYNSNTEIYELWYNYEQMSKLHYKLKNFKRRLSMDSMDLNDLYKFLLAVRQHQINENLHKEIF